MKNIILISFLFFLYSCGYTSIYKEQNNKNFQINIIEMQGDHRFNNLLKNEFKLYSSLKSKNIYDAKIESDFSKIIISKNATGIATNYLLSLKTKIEIKINNKIKNFQFEESIKIKSNSNSFEQNNYENNVKRNFASSIREKLIIKIINIDDN